MTPEQIQKISALGYIVINHGQHVEDTNKNIVMSRNADGTYATDNADLGAIVKPVVKKAKPKKETKIRLTADQKHWLNLVDIRVNAMSFDFIERTYTIDSMGEEHASEYINNEFKVPKDKRKEVALSRVDGLSSIRDYIKSKGSKKQKFHYESSLKGAELYASSLRINPDLIELKDEFVFDFNQVLDIFKLHLDMDQVFEQIDNHIKKITL